MAHALYKSQHLFQSNIGCSYSCKLELVPQRRKPTPVTTCYCMRQMSSSISLRSNETSTMAPAVAALSTSAASSGTVAASVPRASRPIAVPGSVTIPANTHAQYYESPSNEQDLTSLRELTIREKSSSKKFHRVHVSGKWVRKPHSNTR